MPSHPHAVEIDGVPYAVRIPHLEGAADTLPFLENVELLAELHAEGTADRLKAMTNNINDLQQDFEDLVGIRQQIARDGLPFGIVGEVGGDEFVAEVHEVGTVEKIKRLERSIQELEYSMRELDAQYKQAVEVSVTNTRRAQELNEEVQRLRAREDAVEESHGDGHTYDDARSFVQSNPHLNAAEKFSLLHLLQSVQTTHSSSGHALEAAIAVLQFRKGGQPPRKRR